MMKMVTDDEAAIDLRADAMRSTESGKANGSVTAWRMFKIKTVWLGVMSWKGRRCGDLEDGAGVRIKRCGLVRVEKKLANRGWWRRGLDDGWESTVSERAELMLQRTKRRQWNHVRQRKGMEKFEVHTDASGEQSGDGACKVTSRGWVRKRAKRGSQGVEQERRVRGAERQNNVRQYRFDEEALEASQRRSQA